MDVLIFYLHFTGIKGKSVAARATDPNLKSMEIQIGKKLKTVRPLLSTALTCYPSFCFSKVIINLHIAKPNDVRR